MNYNQTQHLLQDSQNTMVNGGKESYQTIMKLHLESLQVYVNSLNSLGSIEKLKLEDKVNTIVLQAKTVCSLLDAAYYRGELFKDKYEGLRGAAMKLADAAGIHYLESADSGTTKTMQQKPAEAVEPEHLTQDLKDEINRHLQEKAELRCEISRLKAEAEAEAEADDEHCHEEKARRIYYQDICYSIANVVDPRGAHKRRTVVGSKEYPSTQLVEAVRALKDQVGVLKLKQKLKEND